MSQTLPSLQRRATVFGVPVHSVRHQEVLDLCQAWLRGDRPRHIVTANPEILLHARTHPTYRALLAQADLIIADGVGLTWASAFLARVHARARPRRRVFLWFLRTLGALLRSPRTLRGPLPERVAGADLLGDIAREAASVGARVILIGGTGETSVRAADALTRQLPILEVSAYAPDHAATPTPSRELDAALRAFAPAVVFVGYGAPAQEEWIHTNLHRYPSIRIAMGVGGALDFLAGNVPRAPSWVQSRGLEWLWRLIHEPTRLRRVLRATLVFPTILLLSTIRAPRPA